VDAVSESLRSPSLVNARTPEIWITGRMPGGFGHACDTEDYNPGAQEN